MSAALLLAFALAHDVVAPPRVEPPPAAPIAPTEAAAPTDAVAPRGLDVLPPAPASRPAIPPAVDEPPPPPPADFSTAEMLMPFAKTMLMLCVVLALVWLTLHKGVGKLVEKAQSGRRVRVVERISLDARRTLYLVEVDGRNLLLAGGEGGVVLLTDVPGAAAKGDFSTVLNARASTSSSTTDATREAT